MFQKPTWARRSRWTPQPEGLLQHGPYFLSVSGTHSHQSLLDYVKSFLLNFNHTSVFWGGVLAKMFLLIQRNVGFLRCMTVFTSHDYHANKHHYFLNVLVKCKRASMTCSYEHTLQLHPLFLMTTVSSRYFHCRKGKLLSICVTISLKSTPNLNGNRWLLGRSDYIERTN